jgi:hypothetical protein
MLSKRDSPMRAGKARGFAPAKNLVQLHQERISINYLIALVRYFAHSNPANRRPESCAKCHTTNATLNLGTIRGRLARLHGRQDSKSGGAFATADNFHEHKNFGVGGTNILCWLPTALKSLRAHSYAGPWPRRRSPGAGPCCQAQLPRCRGVTHAE